MTLQIFLAIALITSFVVAAMASDLADRSEVHRLGLLHRAVHVLVFNSYGQVFLQKRSMKKDRQPGVWDSSASGHVDSGEDYDTTAVREVWEEIGLRLAKTPERLFKINARAETVSDKPMFRDAFRRNRCVIPASGNYEWLKRPDGRQPYFISAADGSVLSFAGLWDRWKNPETGEPVISCTIIVTDANALTGSIHDRMPVVLDNADIRPWLNGEAGTELLRPAAEDRLRMWPVSRRVNKTGTGDEDPTVIDEVTA